MSEWLDKFGPFSAPQKITKSLQDLSSFGMKYDDMVLRNSQAIGVMEDQIGYTNINPFGIADDDLWYPFAALSMSDISFKKKIGFFDRAYREKRDQIRLFAMQDEIEDILDTLCDETIVYDNKNFFAYGDLLNMDVSEDVEKYMNKAFNNIYNYFGFNLDQSAWYYFRKWLIDGYLAFEIIYNDKQDEIIGFKELDAATLVPGVDRQSNKKVWYQFKDIPGKERKLYDSQVIYISYGSITTSSRVSYVERLVRSFNLLRIMEHTRVIWAVTNASFKMKFIIPVGGKSKTCAKQSLAQLMQNYREVVDFDFESADLQVNGKPMMQFNKEYWLPSKDGETPEIETLANEGPDLSDTDALKYFDDKLKLASKIPFSRFDTESPATFEMSADGLIREEIKFGKFINRLRSSFQEILVKPLFIQMALKFPELKNDNAFKNGIALQYNEENMFAELKELEIFQKRADFISSIQDSLVEQDEDLNDVPYFNLNFLIKRFLKMSPDDLEKNDSYKKKNQKKSDDSDDSDDSSLDF
ncbi:MAG: portal protein [Atribacterota bacterium]